MTIDNKKFDIALANSGLNLTQVAERGGLSRQRLAILLNSKVITPKACGKVAKGLGVPVIEIIEE